MNGKKWPVKGESMRVEIKTWQNPNGFSRVKDKDMQALYILAEGIKRSTPRMLEANLRFVLGAHGYGLRKLLKNE